MIQNQAGGRVQGKICDIARFLVTSTPSPERFWYRAKSDFLQREIMQIFRVGEKVLAEGWSVRTSGCITQIAEGCQTDTRLFQ